MVSRPLQPVLVLPVYRGGEKFARALASLAGSEHFFRRVVISLNSREDSPDRIRTEEYVAEHHSKAEVIQTGAELPWMEHQYFWLEHLQATGERGRDWLYWFAHDDQVRPRGIQGLVAADGSWPLTPQTTYLGPWGMRYDPPGGMYEGLADEPLESWTSFPTDGPLRLSVAEWVAQQLEQPTYINMSGCVTQLASFQAMRRFPVHKPGGMRIEMATAAAPNNLWVEEFPEPIVITHTSPVTDRTTYSKVARKDDRHMIAWLVNYISRHPRAVVPTARASWRVMGSYAKAALGRGELATEDWRYRATVEP